jgi:hypothetical protein
VRARKLAYTDVAVRRALRERFAVVLALDDEALDAPETRCTLKTCCTTVTEGVGHRRQKSSTRLCLQQSNDMCTKTSAAYCFRRDKPRGRHTSAMVLVSSHTVSAMLSSARHLFGVTNEAVEGMICPESAQMHL